MIIPSILEMMMTTYNIEISDGILKIGFGDEPATNAQIVRDVKIRLDQMVAAGQLSGGPLLKINGPATLAVAAVLVHRVAHLYEAIAIFDPKLGESGKYVVCIAHGPGHRVGDLIE